MLVPGGIRRYWSNRRGKFAPLRSYRIRSITRVSDWPEQQPEDWWQAVVASTREVMQSGGVKPQDILGITHSHNCWALSHWGGCSPLRLAIIWLDARAPEQAERIMRKFLGRRVFSMLSGAELSGKDGLAKLLWLKENEPDVYERMACFLDVNGFLTYRATGRQVFEWSCASAFGFDLGKKDWLRGIIRYIGLEQGKFPPWCARSTRWEA